VPSRRRCHDSGVCDHSFKCGTDFVSFESKEWTCGREMTKIIYWQINVVYY